jgi:hypothetical protein
MTIEALAFRAAGRITALAKRGDLTAWRFFASTAELGLTREVHRELGRSVNEGQF